MAGDLLQPVSTLPLLAPHLCWGGVAWEGQRCPLLSDAQMTLHLPHPRLPRTRTFGTGMAAYSLEKDLHDPDSHDGVITHLEPDILECEVKWALGNITSYDKASGGDGIPVELFQILKDDAVKVLHSICQQIWKLSSGQRTGKGSFSFQSQRKAMPKNAQTTAQLHSSHMLVK